MYDRSTVDLRERTDIKAIIQCADNNYRKQKASLVERATQVTLNDTYWSGGSIAYYVYVPKHGVVRDLPGMSAPPQFGGKEPEPFQIPKGDAVVRLGTFCGKKAYATVYINN